MDGSPQGNLRRLRLRKPSQTTAPAADEEEEEEAEEEPLSPAARVFHQPKFNCYIISIIGNKTKVNPAVLKAGIEATMIRHPRFHSKVVVDDRRGGKMRWVPTEVNIDDHVIFPDIDPDIKNPDRYVEDYTTDMTRTPLDPSKPLWELHVLNIETSDAGSVSILRIHHSVGDGVSLILLLLACTRKTADLDALPTLPSQMAPHRSRKRRGFWSFWVMLALMIRLIWNTFLDLLSLLATVLFLKDTNTPIKGASDVQLTPKRFVHRTVSFGDIKAVKNAMNTTVNDVVLGLTQAGLTRYLNRRYVENKESLPKNVRLRSSILVNIRPTLGIQAIADMMKTSKFKWGNGIGYVVLPFAIALQRNPLDYVRQAKSTIEHKKLSLESILSHFGAKLVQKTLGEKAAAALVHKILSSTTMSYSNVVGPLEEISFFGNPLTYIAASVYGHPHALTIHFQSYMDKMTIAVAVDENVIPDPHQLLEDLEESLELIKNAAMEETGQ